MRAKGLDDKGAYAKELIKNGLRRTSLIGSLGSLSVKQLNYSKQLLL